MIPNLTFTDALNEFCTQADSRRYLAKKTISSYCCHLNSLEKVNEGKTIQWIKDAISRSRDYSECISYLAQAYDKFMLSLPTTVPIKKRQPYIKSALLNFATFILSYFNASAAVLWGNLIKPRDLAQLVAQTAIFPSQSVVKDVIAGKIGRQENILRMSLNTAFINFSDSLQGNLHQNSRKTIRKSNGDKKIN